MKFIRWSFPILMVLWGTSILVQVVGQFRNSGDYHGTAIDADTGEPIEGAAVTVVWKRRPFITMDGPRYFHNAKEALTDKEGNFSVDSSPGIDWSPFTYRLKEPHIVIFKPGYGPYPVEHVSPRYDLKTSRERLLDFPELNVLLLKGTTVKLRRLKTEEELKRFTSPGSLWLGKIPWGRIPILMRLINIQNNNLGLQPYPGF